jgi:hypothetical protein
MLDNLRGIIPRHGDEFNGLVSWRKQPMSIAKRIVQFDSNFIGWIDIEDDAGDIHHYAKRGVIPNADTVHVRWMGGQTVELASGPDGINLRQDAPGLPDRLVAAFLVLRPRGGRHRRIEFYDYEKAEPS